MKRPTQDTLGCLALGVAAAILHPGQPEGVILTLCFCVVFLLLRKGHPHA